MTEDEDLDGLAAEYVLGSLSPAERREVDARRRQDAALNQAITDWERRLAPLSAAEQGIEPPPELFGRITNRLRGTGDAASGGTVVAMPARRKLGGAPISAIAGIGALAACLLLGIGWLLLSSVPVPRCSSQSCTGATRGRTRIRVRKGRLRSGLPSTSRRTA